MKNAALLIPILCILGCYENSVPLRVCDADMIGCGELSAEANDAIWEAQEILGVELEVTTRPMGAINTILVDSYGNNYPGRYISLGPARRCIKLVYSAPNGRILAHEIGHALGLKHPCETNGHTDCPLRSSKNTCQGRGLNSRLMFPSWGGTLLTDGERDQLTRGLQGLERCRGE